MLLHPDSHTLTQNNPSQMDVSLKEHGNTGDLEAAEPTRETWKPAGTPTTLQTAIQHRNNPVGSVGLAESITKNLGGRTTAVIILFGLCIPQSDHGHNLRQVTNYQAAASQETHMQEGGCLGVRKKG